MDFFKTYEDEIEKVLSALLVKLKINLDRRVINFCLKAHPFHPSFLSISDCLKEWHITNDTYMIAKDEYDPSLFEYPLLAYLSKKKFILINSIEDGIVNYADADNKCATMQEKVFLEVWDGIVLHAEGISKNEKSDKRTISKVSTRTFPFKLALLGALLVVILIAYFTKNFVPSVLLLAIIKLTGLSLTILIIGQSVTSDNNWIKRFCNLKQESECTDVLNSSAAKITSWLSWSEVGFFYFSGSLIAILMSTAFLPFLLIFNMLCLPYTLWSVGYQYKNKSWCILCCGVQIILWFEFLVFYMSFNISKSELTINYLFALSLCFLIPLAIWSFLKPLFLKLKELETVNQELKKVKYNKEIFQHLLTLQPRFIVGNDLLPIKLGSDDAETTITIVSNPFCEPCARAHLVIDELLEYREDLQFKLVFSTSAEKEDPGVKIQKHITALAYSENNGSIREALKMWYDNPKRDYNKWVNDFPVVSMDSAKDVEHYQKHWCTMAEIQITPTILINGYKLPEPYTIDDIKYLLN